MNVKKVLVAGGIFTTVGLASLASVAMVSAAQPATTDKSGLVDKIAQKFNLKTADVQAVFDQNKAEHQADRQAKQKAKLDQAVKDGKITQAQEDKILAKHAELKTQMQAEHDALKDKTKEERRAFMEQKRTELEKWAADNNIPIELLHPGGQGRGHGGPGLNDKL